MTNAGTIFSQRLRQLMEWDRVSKTELATAIDIKKPTVAGLLYNPHLPNSETLMAMADFFGVSVDWLLGRVNGLDETMAKDRFGAVRYVSYVQYLKHDKKEKFIQDGYSSPWPYNLIEEILGEPLDSALTDDQMRGFVYILNCMGSDRTRDFVIMYYKDDMTLDEIAKKAHLTRERIRQIIAKAIRIARHPSNSSKILYGLEGNKLRRKCEMLRLELEKKKSELEEKLNTVHEEIIEADRPEPLPKPGSDDVLGLTVAELDLSVRSYNCLKRKGCDTVADVLKLAYENPYNYVDIADKPNELFIANLKNIRNMGKHSVEEVVGKLRTLGIYPIAV